MLYLLALVISGFVIGGLARFAVPGPDPMPIWMTIAIGVAGSIVGGFLATEVLNVADSDEFDFGSFLIAVGASVALLAVATPLLTRGVEKKEIERR